MPKDLATKYHVTPRADRLDPDRDTSIASAFSARELHEWTEEAIGQMRTAANKDLPRAFRDGFLKAVTSELRAFVKPFVADVL